jgi:endo-1,4-beta-xylanase
MNTITSPTGKVVSCALAVKKNPIKTGLAIFIVSAMGIVAMGQTASPANPANPPANPANPSAATAAPTTHPALPPVPLPMAIPTPGPQTDKPYQPLPILQGGLVLTLFPPDSKYLYQPSIKIPEVYNMTRNVPGRIQSIISIHNPSIEVHAGDPTLNTGVCIILAAGGGHNTLNVGGESADFVYYFYNYGINTVILRNRLRVDGYDPKTDEVYDAQQAIRLVRAHAKEWLIDPNKIGIMGFSAGAELAAPAAVNYPEWDKNNSDPSDPLAGISSRPDFAGIIYPGPTPFANGATPTIPRDCPPAFIACAGWGDKGHAVWANDYFTAMLNFGIPNVEMHIYARGHHPGDQVQAWEPPSTGGLTDRGFIEYGTWPNSFMAWMRDLGFMDKSGVETQAAKDSKAFASQPARGAGRRGGRRGAGATTAPAGLRGGAPRAGAPATP